MATVRDLRKCLAAYNAAVGMAKVAKASILLGMIVDVLGEILEGRENGI